MLIGVALSFLWGASATGQFMALAIAGAWFVVWLNAQQSSHEGVRAAVEDRGVQIGGWVMFWLLALWALYLRIRLSHSLPDVYLHTPVRFTNFGSKRLTDSVEFSYDWLSKVSATHVGGGPWVRTPTGLPHARPCAP
jgi:hypothetical protein